MRLIYFMRYIEDLPITKKEAGMTDKDKDANVLPPTRGTGSQQDAEPWELEAVLATYLLREMPAGTVIGNPVWWAARIASAIERELTGRCRAQGGSTNDKASPVLAQAGVSAEPAKLDDIEQYRLQMAAISTAAIGYWTEADSIQPEYDTPALRDVAKLYAKYAALHAQVPAAEVRAQALEEPAMYLSDDEMDAAHDAIDIAQSSIADKASEVRAAEVETEEWSYSTDEEQYHEQEPSRRAIIQHALAELEERDDGSSSFWIGRNVRFTGKGDAGSIIDALQEQAYEECGEFAETYLQDVTAAEESELESLVTSWAKRVDRSNFWTVTAVEHWTVEQAREYLAAPSTADSGNTGALGEGVEA